MVQNPMRGLLDRSVCFIAVLLVFGLIETAIAVPSTVADNQNTGGSKGVTVDDLGRGLKSAAQNVEKEIPKMGSAIGTAFKKITQKGTDKTSSHEPTTQKK